MTREIELWRASFIIKVSIILDKYFINLSRQSEMFNQ